MEQAKVTDTGNKVLIALGGNAPSDIGEPLVTLHKALASIRDEWGEVTLSKLYCTPAFPVDTGPEFVNATCSFHSESAPEEILNALHEIENRFGRTRHQRWGARTLDLDLIAVGGLVQPDLPTYRHWRDLPPDTQRTAAPDQLILPHPRLQDRPFVLVPLADIAPDWVHPVLGQTVAQMLAAHPVAARAEIKQL